MACAKASGFRSTNVPTDDEDTISGIPPTPVASTGRPQAIASNRTFGQPSCELDRQNRSAAKAGTGRNFKASTPFSTTVIFWLGHPRFDIMFLSDCETAITASAWARARRTNGLIVLS